MRILNPTISGSLVVTGSTNIIGVLSASFIRGDGSGLSGVTSYTDSDTLSYINSIGVVSGSVNWDTLSGKPANIVSSSAQLSDQTIPGNLTVGGVLTAQEFHTEFVSASIIYESGSTQFGNSLDDIHNFLGSLAVNTNNLFVSGGNVGIGTTSSANKLQIGSVGSSNYSGNDIVVGNGTQVVALYQSSTTSTFYTNTQFGFMNSGGGTGNVGIGTTSPAEKLHVAGNIVATGDVTAYYSSDERLKDNKKVIQNSLDKINKISGYTFDWKETPSFGVPKNDIGVIAQEIEEILPQIVTDREDGYKAVRYEKIIPLLIEGIKELTKSREEDKNRITKLEQILKNNGITK